MSGFRVAIIGCGTVGGGVAKILLENQEALAVRAGRRIDLARIVDLFPAASARRHGLPLDRYCSKKERLSAQEAAGHIREILDDHSIDLVVETVGGADGKMVELLASILEHKKHLVTANKALLAGNGAELFATAARQGVALGYEASVCGAIPIIRAVNECLTGDRIHSISGIMNGTSNYILSQMQSAGQSFKSALAAAQKQGYAEADPTLDISGGDAGHKLTVLLQILFGLRVSENDLAIRGIRRVDTHDMAFASEMGCSIKLICYAQKQDEVVYATVRPMMVKMANLLSKIGGATNAVRLVGKYAGESLLVGKGAGSLETGSAVVSDIVFIARYGKKAVRGYPVSGCRFRPFDELDFPYNITFETRDQPGITGIVATAIGKQAINIDTVSHNRHHRGNAVFCIVTMPCNCNQIRRAIDDIRSQYPKALRARPKITPILEG